MPLVLNKLTEKFVRTVDKVGLYGDGGGLWLQVTRTGNKSWIFRYQRSGKMHSIGLGPVHTITLPKARLRARDAREQLISGVDLIGRRQQMKIASGMTFRACAEACMESLSPDWKNPKHADQWRNTLSTYAYPLIGDRPVSSIETPDVLSVLQPIWETKRETATRLRSRIERVLSWAKVAGYRAGDNPAAWRGHLDNVLSKQNKRLLVKNRPALPWQRMGDFMAKLRGIEGCSARALEFAILTATRSAETTNATWNEINFDTAEWTIPASRMKAGKPHIVPLSPAAVALLKALPRDTSGFLFSGKLRNSPLSAMAMLQTVRRMNSERTEWVDAHGSPIVPHGFRSTFRDWAGETTTYQREVMEHALAHRLPDETEAAYARSTLLPKRRRLMEAWAEFLARPSTTTGCDVVLIRQSA